MWALQVSKNGRTVKSIYSHNIFSSFATKKWHFYRKYAQPPGRWGLGIFTVKMHTIKWGWAYLRKKITVNMPTLKSSLIKPSKSMLFFHIWNANFSVTPINSQMYMTKPKQVQKKLSENTGKTFSIIMPPFTSRGGGHNCGNYCTRPICGLKYFPLSRHSCNLVQSSLCQFTTGRHAKRLDQQGFNFLPW